jgi:predicted TPR repeat methyltransferase
MELHIWTCSMELTLHLDLGCGTYLYQNLRRGTFIIRVTAVENLLLSGLNSVGLTLHLDLGCGTHLYQNSRRETSIIRVTAVENLLLYGLNSVELTL